MAMTSQAEAKLGARIRPELTVLRSRTPYPKRRGQAGAEAWASAPNSDADGSGMAAGRESTVHQPGLPAARVPAARIPPRPAPVRLTRRGRVVVGVLVAIGVAVLAGLLWLTIEGQAQASSHLPGGSPRGQGLIRVVVRSGQTLWSIAVHADPSADPRVVIGEILADNQLTGSGIQAGQVLWVPRG